MKTVALLAVLFLCSLPLQAQEMVQGGHHHTPPAPLDSESAELQDWAKQRLAKSTRKQEWVKVKQGTREVNSLVVHPASKGKTTAVIVIHENGGLTDWVQSLADQVAEAGYLAIAPDLLSGMGPNGGGTSSLPDRNAVGQAFRDLPPDQITADLSCRTRTGKSSSEVSAGAAVKRSASRRITPTSKPRSFSMVQRRRRPKARTKKHSQRSRRLCTASTPGTTLASTPTCLRLSS